MASNASKNNINISYHSLDEYEAVQKKQQQQQRQQTVKYIYQNIYSSNNTPTIITLAHICILKKLEDIQPGSQYIAISKYNINNIYLTPVISTYNQSLFTDSKMLFLSAFNDDVTKYVYYYLKNNIHAFQHINKLIQSCCLNSQPLDCVSEEIMRLHIPNLSLTQLDIELDKIELYNKSIKEYNDAIFNIEEEEKLLIKRLNKIKNKKEITMRKIIKEKKRRDSVFNYFK